MVLRVKILVSCCNKIENPELKNPGVYLFRVDTDGGAITPVAIDGLHEAHGITGIAECPDGYLALVQNNVNRAVRRDPIRLVRLSRSFEARAIIDLHKVIDPHSLLMRGEQCLIVSSGTDEIISLDRFENESVYASLMDHDAADKQDILHVNSICAMNDKLYISAFGRSSGELRLTATRGWISSLEPRERVMEELHHPHSLHAFKGEFWFCESGRGMVRHQDEVVAAIESGYVRGLAVADDDLFVGLSKRRKVSKSKQVAVPNVHPEKIGRCEVLHYRKRDGAWQLHQSIPFDGYSDEIYDILIMGS
jgi:hypothetical protein